MCWFIHLLMLDFVNFGSACLVRLKHSQCFFGLDGHGFSANNDQSMIRESLKNAKSRFKPTEISLEFTIKKLQNKPVCQAEWEQNFCAWCRHHGYVYLTHRQ